MGGYFFHAIRWTPQDGPKDISSLDAPWFDLETNTSVHGWIFRGALDMNEAGQMAGSAWDGNSIRACAYSALTGFRLLPRSAEPPYNEASCTYRIDAINDKGEAQGSVRPEEYPWKTFLWSPANPYAIHIVEAAAETEMSSRGIGSNIFSVWDEGSPGHIDLYGFQFNNDGVLSYEPLDTVAHTTGMCATYINENGAFAYSNSNGTTQSIKLYLPDRGSLTVHESPSGAYATVGTRINNSSDFMYNFGNVPYLYRGGKNRSYRLYDLADGYTKSVLFASSVGDVNGTICFSVVSDDNVADAPADEPFDAIGGTVVNPGVAFGIVLTPVPKQ